MKTCSICGRQVEETVKCQYQRQGVETCPDCCDKCFQTEPFVCYEHDQRVKKVTAPFRGPQAVKKWAETLDLPEDQVVPCLTAFVCGRYHRKSPVIRKTSRGKTGLWTALKTGAVLARWNVDLKADPWNEIDRIRAFAVQWKKTQKEGEAL